MHDELARLAELHGVQLAYRDVDDEVQRADRDALLAVLRALGVPVDDPGDAGAALAAYERGRWDRRVEPVVAAFDGEAVPVEVRLARSELTGVLRCQLTLEAGGTHNWTERIQGLERTAAAEVDGREQITAVVPVRHLPHGHHRLTVELDGRRCETRLIVAPARTYAPGPPAADWGAFLPLWALRTRRDWGVGDLTDLRELAAWAGELGASYVGTLPLLPVYLGGGTAADPAAAREPIDPSPYSPVSRLFWNELFLDLERVPELERCAEARRLLAADDTRTAIAELRGLRHVDYRRVAAVKGRILGALAECFHRDAGDERRSDLDRFLADRPEAAVYARFRGAVARHGSAWWDWSGELRERRELRARDIDLLTMRLHVYAQLVADDQVGSFSRDLRDDGQHPYLDLPIGTRRDGFDVWRHRELFAVDADTGAPPDTIFTGGQNWRFPPLHPERIREDGYGYVRDVLDHHLALADALRIDHVMGLHRLYWIPEGLDAADGVYVTYPADEWYAVLSLASHRHGSRIIGENLGTVPAFVEDALAERGITRMYVVQYEATPDRYDVLDPVPADTVASVNTHDMPPFAAWWTGEDLRDGLDLGHLAEDEAAAVGDERAIIRRHVTAMLEAEGRVGEGTTDPGEVLAGLLEWLADGHATLVLVNLEDLWLEDEPQNVPGTSDERPNWRRRAARTLEEMRDDPRVVDALARVAAARRRGRVRRDRGGA